MRGMIVKQETIGTIETSIYQVSHKDFQVIQNGKEVCSPTANMKDLRFFWEVAIIAAKALTSK